MPSAVRRSCTPRALLLGLVPLVTSGANPASAQAWRMSAMADVSTGQGQPAVGTREWMTLGGVQLRADGPVQLGARGVGVLGDQWRRAALGNAWVAAPLGRGITVGAAAAHLVSSGASRTTRLDATLDHTWRGRWPVALTVRPFVGQLGYAGLRFTDWGVDVALQDEQPRAVQLGVTARAIVAPRDELSLGAIGLRTLPAETNFPPFTPLNPRSAVAVVDLSSLARWRLARMTFDAAVTGRVVRDARGPLLAAQLAAELPVGERVRLVAGLGSQLPDVRLMLGRVRWMSVGMRVGWPRTMVRRARPRGDGAAMVLRVERARIVVVTLARVARLELRGDFTGFAPRACRAIGTSRFDCGEAPAPGAHRVAIRADDGPWRAPGNLPPVRDDFDAEDGDWVLAAP
ncbi:MAG: hypothetical protein MUF21_09450 [Gemmatimonadaceae bacterium]|jgi:hypothetical protein|nr:hypothetical protein [Gemmatimonadaceae bacterium]